MKKYIIPILAIILIATPVYAFTLFGRNFTFGNQDQTFGASTLRVYQGGTGATSFSAGQCLVGNGTGAVTTATCGAGSGGSSIFSTTTPGVYYLTDQARRTVFGGNATTTNDFLQALNGFYANTAKIGTLAGYIKGTTGTLSATTTVPWADLINVPSYEPAFASGTSAQYYRGDKTWVTLDKTAVGLGNVVNLDTSNPANITQSASYRFVTDTEKSTWNGKESVLSFSNGLTRAVNAITCDTASSTVFGCLTASNFNIFNAKVATTTQVIAGTGLSGGGDLSTNRTLTLNMAGGTCGGTDKISALSATGTITCTADTGGAGSPGGADTQVQFNSAGTFAGSDFFRWETAISPRILIGTSTTYELGLTENSINFFGANNNQNPFIYVNSNNLRFSYDSYAVGDDNGGSMTFNGGTGSGTGNGGDVVFYAGPAGGSGAGGNVYFVPGASTSSIGYVAVVDIASEALAKLGTSLISPSISRLYQFPDKDGTFAMLSDITGGSGGGSNWATSTTGVLYPNDYATRRIVTGGNSTTTNDFLQALNGFYANTAKIGASTGLAYLTSGTVGVTSTIGFSSITGVPFYLSTTTWGGIGGTLSNQTDLQNALNAKLSLTATSSIDHNSTSGLQGGQSNQYYHLTSAQATVVSNTSGTNSGNETTSTIGTLINGSPATTSPQSGEYFAMGIGSVLKKLGISDFLTWLRTFFQEKILGLDFTISGNMKLVAPSSVTNATSTGTIIPMTVAQNTYGFGCLLYVNSTSSLSMANGTTTTTIPAVFMALETGVGTKNVLQSGIARSDTWNFTVGSPVYVSTSTPCAPTSTMPTATSQTIQIVGVATATNTIDFLPQLTWIGL